MQTSTIICKNATSEIVHLDTATKIHVPENCHVNLPNTPSLPLLPVEFLPHHCNLPGHGILLPYHPLLYITHNTWIPWLMNSETKFTTFKQTFQTPLILKTCTLNQHTLSLALQLSSG
jgi:hypothetical protein